MTLDTPPPLTKPPKPDPKFKVPTAPITSFAALERFQTAHAVSNDVRTPTQQVPENPGIIIHEKCGWALSAHPWIV
jgi:hypothetical protein